MIKVGLAVGEKDFAPYADWLRVHPQIEYLEAERRAEAEILLYTPESDLMDFRPFSQLRYVQSLWAGVEKLLGNSTLSAPICRLVDEGLSQGMREYCLAYILSDMYRLPEFARARTWTPQELPLAAYRTVAIVGCGVLGQSVGRALQNLNFQVIGWSRSEKSLPFAHEYGEENLHKVLNMADYVITLLPATKETEQIINAEFLAHMKPNSLLINPGRGSLLDENALLMALKNAEIRGAVLDVFAVEPLPDAHQFWQEDRILITPHIAAKSRFETAIAVVDENFQRFARNQPLRYQVSREQGY